MTELNGVELELLEEGLKLVEKQAGEPERLKGLNTRRARASWPGGLRARVRAGNGAFVVDESIGPEPVETPTAVEYLLGTLGACVVIGFVYLATRRGVKLHNLEAALEGELDNSLVFLGLSDEGHPGYKRIKLTLYVSADAGDETLQKLFEETLRRSPVVNTLRNLVEVEGALRVV